MKKAVHLMFVALFLLAVSIPNLAVADDKEGSGTKTHKPAKEKEEGSGSSAGSGDHKGEKHSKEYKSGKAGYMEEGSGGDKAHDQGSGHETKNEGSETDPAKEKETHKREGS